MIYPLASSLRCQRVIFDSLLDKIFHFESADSYRFYHLLKMYEGMKLFS